MDVGKAGPQIQRQTCALHTELITATFHSEGQNKEGKTETPTLSLKSLGHHSTEKTTQQSWCDAASFSVKAFQ